MNGFPKASATRAPYAIAPVATPAIISASLKYWLIISTNDSVMMRLTLGKERRILLSQ